MSTSANKPIEDIEASLLAATKWALDELLRQADATMAAKAGGDFSPGSPIEGYDHASSYLRQVLVHRNYRSGHRTRRIGARWNGRRDGGGGVRRSVCVGCGCLSHCLIGEKRS
jgi:hypothetical protein